MPVYFLEVAPGGSKLTAWHAGDHTKSGGPSVRSKSRSSTGSSMDGDNLSTSKLADNLAGFVGRTVIDKTGLTGAYQFTLAWTPLSARTSGSAQTPADAPPDIFTAIRQQLGLALKPGTGPAKVLVVDQIYHPSPD